MAVSPVSGSVMRPRRIWPRRAVTALSAPPQRSLTASMAA